MQKKRLLLELHLYNFTFVNSEGIFCLFVCYLHCHVNTPPLCVTGRGEDLEEGQEEDPQQAVCSGEPQEEEGVRRRTGKQVRRRR